jgi:hypothetical protein
VLLVALAAWYWKIYWVTLSLACATLAWATGWYESTNLWDYLFDPFVAAYALVAVSSQTSKIIFKSNLNNA